MTTSKLSKIQVVKAIKDRDNREWSTRRHGCNSRSSFLFRGSTSTLKPKLGSSLEGRIIRPSLAGISGPPIWVTPRKVLSRFRPPSRGADYPATPGRIIRPSISLTDNPAQLSTHLISLMLLSNTQNLRETKFALSGALLVAHPG
jgi:hypothetical protein